MNILICEDERLIALDLRNSVVNMGHTVVKICHTGTDLIDEVRELEPELILTDISLKGELSGIEAIKIIQAWKYIPFIYISGLKDENTFQMAMQTSPCAFIAKPFNYFELKSQIEKCLDITKNSDKLDSIEGVTSIIEEK